MLNKKYNAVLIDPTVIADLEYDFLGINSVALPALYGLIERKRTSLLDCNVLRQQIRSGVRQSSLVYEMNRLSGYCDDLEMLKLLGEEVDNALTVLKGVDLQQQLVERFEQLYSNATMMTACNANDVITLYYSKLPPFDKVGEDFEMADAFVLSTFIDHANSHADERFLVVSRNDDWENVLKNLGNVDIVYSAEQVMEKWLPENGFARQLYKRFHQKIEEKIDRVLNQRDYVVTNDGDVQLSAYVERIHVYNRYLSPLLVTDRKAVYRVFVEADVYGNYERRYCLFENDRLIRINDGTASVALEVEVTFDKSDVVNTANVSTVKVIDRGAIPVYVGCDD